MKIEIEGMELEVGSVTLALRAPIKAEIGYNEVELVRALCSRNGGLVEVNNGGVQKKDGVFELELTMKLVSENPLFPTEEAKHRRTEEAMCDERELYATGGR